MSKPFLSAALFSAQLAEQCAARHRTPKATVTHPPGVIVPHDELLTENIKDPDYVPYCGPCDPMQRMRRVVDGFKCPTCGTHTNWDLTKFNNNVDVKFEEGYSAPTTVLSDPGIQRDWVCDRNKKNVVYSPCVRCHATFSGKRNRKRCYACSLHQ